MPVLTVEFTDEELALITEAAERAGKPTAIYAHDVVMDWVRNAKVAAAMTARR